MLREWLSVNCQVRSGASSVRQCNLGDEKPRHTPKVKSSSTIDCLSGWLTRGEWFSPLNLILPMQNGVQNLS